MKGTFITTIIVIISTVLNAQISLEQTYIAENVDENAGITSLESAGKKYFVYEAGAYKLKLYNLDHSLYKEINIDITSVIDTSIYINQEYNLPFYITENLFDTDNEVEFLLYVFLYDASFSPIIERRTLIVNEDGSILLNKGNTWVDFEHLYLNPPIQNTIEGTKMILFFGRDSAAVYSLPGQLPCDNACNDSMSTGFKSPSLFQQKPRSLNIYPNPTTNIVNVDYSLPEGVDQGELVLLDVEGREIKRYKIDRSFNYLSLSTSDLTSGLYFINMETSIETISGQKLLKIE